MRDESGEGLSLLPPPSSLILGRSLGRGAEGRGGAQPRQEGSPARAAQVDPRQRAGQLAGRLQHGHRAIDSSPAAIAGNGCVSHDILISYSSSLIAGETRSGGPNLGFGPAGPMGLPAVSHASPPRSPPRRCQGGQYVPPDQGHIDPPSIAALTSANASRSWSGHGTP